MVNDLFDYVGRLKSLVIGCHCHQGITDVMVLSGEGGEEELSVLPIFQWPAIKGALHADLNVLVELLFKGTIVDEVRLHQLVELETREESSCLLELALKVLPTLLGIGQGSVDLEVLEFKLEGRGYSVEDETTSFHLTHLQPVCLGSIHNGGRRVVSNEGAPKSTALHGRLNLDGSGLVVGLAFEFWDKAYGRGGEGIAHD